MYIFDLLIDLLGICLTFISAIWLFLTIRRLWEIIEKDELNMGVDTLGRNKAIKKVRSMNGITLG